jgi:UDP-2,4-diacetamido-2,4,6-trideoxy-beta-L-altropyranose hydrolase
MHNRKIYFRADADKQIGYGHFTRTLALADMLKDEFDCTFFTQTPTLYQREEVLKVCKLQELPSTDAKFPLFLDFLTGEEIVVLDNYFFTTEYQRQIKAKGCKLVCVDDMHDKHYVADAVINHGLTDATLFSKEPYTRLCLGMDWALLRRPFLASTHAVQREQGHWLIAFGGSDYFNLTEKFVRMIHGKAEVKQISVVVGDAYAHLDTLKDYPKISVQKNLTADEMANLMQRCEYAILPSSGICIEALSQGCKIFAGYYVENQKEIYGQLTGMKVIAPLGDLRACESFDLIPSDTQTTRIDFEHIPLHYIQLFKSL